MPLLQFHSVDTTEDEREFLQSRVAGFGLLAGSLNLAFWLYRLGVCIVTPPDDTAPVGGFFEDPVTWLHLAGGLTFLAVWLVCRGGKRSVRVVLAAETGGWLFAATLYLVMGVFIPWLARPDLIVVLALGLGFFTRCVFVPSSPIRTAALGTALLLPLLVTTYILYLDVDPSPWEPFEPGFAKSTPSGVATFYAVNAAVWWLATVVVCTAATKVIYGLRKQVHDVKKLGQYAIEGKLGEGGMGVVYRARHAMLRRPTAVKLLHPDRAGEQSIARFEKEVQQTARLMHPNTIRIYDYGRTPDGLFYYAMELLDGVTLDQLVEIDGPQTPGRTIHILDQVAGALAEAHSLSLIHRDIKPANIVISNRGGLADFVKVLDFGLVKSLDAPQDAALTAVGTITGTPHYLSPEAIRSPDKVTPACDIYALGGVGYFLLTGAPVFEAESAVDVLSSHLHAVPQAPSERLGRTVPGDLEAIILSALAKDPAARPADAGEFRQRLLDCTAYHAWTDQDARSWWERSADKIAGVAARLDPTETPTATEETVPVIPPTIDIETPPQAHS